MQPVSMLKEKKSNEVCLFEWFWFNMRQSLGTLLFDKLITGTKLSV